MNRRKFIKQGTVTSAASLLTGQGISALTGLSGQAVEPFQLKYAPHLGMFKHHAGDDPVAQLEFMADQGFSAFEDNGMKDREVSMQEKMAMTMQRRNLQMGVFVAHKIYWNEPNLTNGDADKRTEFLQHIRESVEVAKRVNATWMTVVPGHVELRLEMGFQTAHVVESLKQAAAILEPHGLVMVLEMLNFRDHPGQFLKKAAQAYEICKAVDSPSCKMLFDIYHQQITEGNLIPNMELAWEEIGYFQIGDNPGRKEPTTGEINYRNVFKYIHSRGWQGILGMEHGNSQSGPEGEMAVIKAYRESDRF
ncbi:MAG: TIM barrel protein [Saprospiraceae bacterium]|nr:TIM barrel protein [Saprospiraceae bacterium]